MPWYSHISFPKNTNPYYWLWGGMQLNSPKIWTRLTPLNPSVNRWVSTRFNLLSSGIIGVTAVISLLNPNISASLAGFALAFASSVTGDVSDRIIVGSLL